MQRAGPKIDVQVSAVRDLARGIKRYDLIRCDGAAFPDLAVGAHITVHMREDLARAYSLIVTGADLKSCAIAVKYEPRSAGGSHFMHKQVVAGARLSIDPPKSSFPLAEAPGLSLFLAGGIGITPIWTMIQECERRARPWRLYYAAKSRADAAFAEELQHHPNVQMVLSDTRRARLDIRALVETAPDDAHLYCCGAAGMLADFQEAARNRPSSNVHFESFAPAPITADRHAITVELARTGRTVQVPPDKSIAEALFQAGVRVKVSCRQGNCGTCEVDVIRGLPDHHDEVLTETERAANKTMMVCCSWCKGEHLVLDI